MLIANTVRTSIFHGDSGTPAPVGDASTRPSNLKASGLFPDKELCTSNRIRFAPE